MNTTNTQKNSAIPDNHLPWDIEITPPKFLSPLKWNEFFRYKNLLGLLVYRDFVVYYKQTILGPLWWLLQPVITSGVFVIFFGFILKVPMDGGTPLMLFFLSGLTLWFYFSNSLNQIANLFASNGSMFEKVYFPRLIIPISQLLSNLMKLTLELIFLAIVYTVLCFQGAQVRPTWWLLLSPIIIFYLAVLALGFGLLFNSLTYKYKDLSLTLPFIIQIGMFTSSVIHPVSAIPKEILYYLYFNPVIPAIELFRFMLTGQGTIYPDQIVTGIVVTVVLLLLGIMSFSYTEKRFIDTI
ncbi:MAG: ABC transporter permease [Planctomycetaceae bacterium]|jgi:lipopolysaccharide transport system permease protein|nr:ABC transporter permease [Planctomycetaceae bacterium]